MELLIRKKFIGQSILLILNIHRIKETAEPDIFENAFQMINFYFRNVCCKMSFIDKITDNLGKTLKNDLKF